MPSIATQVTVPISFADGFETTGEFVTFNNLSDDGEHIAIALGSILDRDNVSGEHSDHTSSCDQAPVLVRLHSECLTGDVFGSKRCDCGSQLREAVEEISKVGGYLIYLRQEGRGIGLYSKLSAYRLQDTGLDTFAANRAIGRLDDERSYVVAAEMLKALGVNEIELLSNNPDKAAQLRQEGINIVASTPTGVFVSESNKAYLEAKVTHAAHTISFETPN